MAESHFTASGHFQGSQRDANLTLRKRGDWSLSLAVEYIEAADADAGKHAVV